MPSDAAHDLRMEICDFGWNWRKLIFGQFLGARTSKITFSLLPSNMKNHNSAPKSSYLWAQHMTPLNQPKFDKWPYKTWIHASNHASMSISLGNIANLSVPRVFPRKLWLPWKQPYKPCWARIRTTQLWLFEKFTSPATSQYRNYFVLPQLRLFWHHLFWCTINRKVQEAMQSWAPVSWLPLSFYQCIHDGKHTHHCTCSSFAQYFHFAHPIFNFSV